MKTKSLFLSTVLTFALTLPVFGEVTHDDTTRTAIKHHDVSSMMGKPTFDATVEGLRMKVWLMTQVQHKKMMKGKMGQMMMHGEEEGTMGRMETKGMRDTSMGMKRAIRDSMMAGTHHIMLDLTDAVAGKVIANASARVLIVSPSKKNSSVDLKAMRSHFGAALSLDEKGDYQFTVNVDVGGVSKTTQFHYAVK